MPSYETIAVTQLSPHIGAENGGANLAKPLGNQMFQEIHDALMQHQVIFFRDQAMSLEEHKAFARRFGPLHIHPAAPSLKDHPEVLVHEWCSAKAQINGSGVHITATFGFFLSGLVYQDVVRRLGEMPRERGRE